MKLVHDPAATSERAEAVPLDVTPDAPSPGAPEPPSVGDRFRLYSLSALTLAFLLLCALLAWPFLPAITWGVALAILAWPMHRLIVAHVNPPWLAAGFSTAIVTLAILAAGAFAAYQLGKEASQAAQKAEANRGESGVREQVARVPGGAQAVRWVERLGFDVEGQFRQLVTRYTQDLASLGQGSVAAAIQFLMAVFILFFVFKDREKFAKGLRSILPLSAAESEQVFSRASDSVHANLYATVVSSFVQSAGVGLVMWWVGLPAPMLWTVVMLILGILPILGAGVIWVPAGVYLMFEGRTEAGALVLVAGTLLTGLAAVVHVRIAGPRMRMHDVPMLLSFLGGLALFGVSGMVLGPAILAVTVALLDVWQCRLTGHKSNLGIVGPGEPVPAP